jgi:outer membrane protein OmpA-like peptidoglycan-associated protein
LGCVDHEVSVEVEQNSVGRDEQEPVVARLGHEDPIEGVVLDQVGKPADALRVGRRDVEQYESLLSEQRSRTAVGLLPRDVSLPIGHPDARADFDPVVVADFAVNDASVKASTAAELRSGAWISIIERQAAKKLEFVGFTDCAGAEGRNASLRQQRAESVAALFPAARGLATSIGPAPTGGTRRPMPR